MADRTLTAFQRSELARPSGAILGVEEELRGEVVADVPDLLARVDLITESDDALTITDFKTARSRWSRQHVHDASEQLLLYGELARDLAPRKPLRLQFAVITKAKTPAVEVYDVAAVPVAVQRTKRVVQRVWRAIKAGHFYPAPSPLNCRSCPFQEVFFSSAPPCTTLAITGIR